jgi:hypothetical protein
MSLLPRHTPCSETGRKRNVANSWWKSRRSRSTIAAACREGSGTAERPCTMSSISCTLRQTEKVEMVCGGRCEGDTRVVAHESLDGLAAAQEARHLPQPHPRERDRHDGLVLAPGPCPDGQSRERGDARPAAQELEPHVPPACQHAPQRVAGQEALERRLVAPLREDRETADLEPVRRHRGGAEPHERQALGVVETRRGGGGRTEERPHPDPARHLGEVEGVERHDTRSSL